MKKLIVAVLLSAVLAPAALAGTFEDGPYITGIWHNPAHPLQSVSFMYTSQMAFDGMKTDVMIAGHKADPKDTLWPQKALDLGLPPLSYSLLDLGFGGNSHTAFVTLGPSVEVAHTLLGPLTIAMNKAGGNWATASKIISAPDGSGVRIGLAWKATVLDNSGVPRLDQIRFPPRYTFGYAYQW